MQIKSDPIRMCQKFYFDNNIAKHENAQHGSFYGRQISEKAEPSVEASGVVVVAGVVVVDISEKKKTFEFTT